MTVFSYHNIELYKSESLGSGSYGGVCKAKCDGLLCAAKIMHPTLFDLRDPGTASYLRKFREECHLLSLARHPNVVQYLGTYTDPDTQLPVLLMELCDESLTSFLERSPGPLSYHIQVNICHDIALALVYLHSNGLIHRDLTGNNILMIAGSRAKITDFGMSKLAPVNPRMTALTLCPGNALYMSPEALDKAKSYTSKLDIFSFGVIVIQILTRLFPNPIDRFRNISVRKEKKEEGSDDDVEKEVWEVVPEIERRQAHLSLILDTHPLKPLAQNCFSQKEKRRPSALELIERLSQLKNSSDYTDSMHQAECSGGSQIPDTQLQYKMEKLQAQHTRITELENLIHDKDEQLHAKDEQLQEKDEQLQAKDEQLQAKDEQLRIKSEQADEIQLTLATRDRSLERKRRKLQQTEGQLRAFKELYEQVVQRRDKTINDLQQTISTHVKNIQQLEQQHTASRPDLPQQKPPHTTVAAAQNITNMRWRKGENSPIVMCRGVEVVHGNVAFFRPFDSQIIYEYQINIHGEEQWSQLPHIPLKGCGLAVVDGLLTSVGGWSNGYTSTLLSLRQEGETQEWSEVLPPMPTPRCSAVCVTTECALVVAGGIGIGGDNVLDTVDVMMSDTKRWTTVSPLPLKTTLFSVVVHGNTLYLAGGLTDSFTSTKSVFTCSLSDLLPPTTLGSKIRRTFFRTHTPWREISSLPVTWSTLVSFGGEVLAVGGKDDSEQPTSNVYSYDSNSNSWTVASQMKNERSLSLAVNFLDKQLVVVGGFTNRVEIFD